MKKHIGVNWHEDQRDKGPFSIRIGGSNDFVTKIDPYDRTPAAGETAGQGSGSGAEIDEGLPWNSDLESLESFEERVGESGTVFAVVRRGESEVGFHMSIGRNGLSA